MFSPKHLLTGLIAAALLSACSTLSTRTQKLSLGMTKDQVVAVLGKDFQTVGAREGSDARKVEVIRYQDEATGELLCYFRDGKLVQWGDTRALADFPQ
jgi:hypothetical protein